MNRSDLLAKLEKARADVHFHKWLLDDDVCKRDEAKERAQQLAAAETRRDEAERELREFDDYERRNSDLRLADIWKLSRALITARAANQ